MYGGYVKSNFELQNCRLWQDLFNIGISPVWHITAKTTSNKFFGFMDETFFHPSKRNPPIV